MPAGVCSQRAFDNTRPSEGGRTPRAEHASPCSDVTRDATPYFLTAPCTIFLLSLAIPIDISTV